MNSNNVIPCPASLVYIRVGNLIRVVNQFSQIQNEYTKKRLLLFD